MSTKILSLAQIKGGCGKTTIASHVIGSLLKQEKTVVGIDADCPQYSLTDWFNSGYEKPNFDLVQAKNSDEMIKAIALYDGKVDYIVIDLAPRLADLTRAGIAVSDLTIIPVNTDLIEIRALKHTLSLMDEAKEKLPDFKYYVMTNKYAEHNENHRVMRDGILQQYKCPMLDASLGERTAFPRAVGMGLTIHDVTPKPVKAVNEMDNLITEIITKLEN